MQEWASNYIDGGVTLQEQVSATLKTDDGEEVIVGGAFIDG